jgi:hypothetical protein
VHDASWGTDRHGWEPAQTGVVILFGANLSKCSHHSAAPCGKAYQVPDRLHSPYTMPHRQVATITPKLASSNTHSIAFFAYVGVDAFSFILGTIPAGGSTVMNRKGKWPRGNMPPEAPGRTRGTAVSDGVLPCCRRFSAWPPLLRF